MPDLTDPITLTLTWLFIGAVIWACVYVAGIVAETKLRRMARGRSTGAIDVALATATAIVCWPVVLAAFFRRARR